ncbi:hypothetical protein ACFVW8_20575 [Streptomyces sp. NPDC058221]|uniref:hypothetical protein n=1 Tax=Streptomyces sp. NPDC058221 TaxID=3346388 RepID=UPI0036EB9732
MRDEELPRRLRDAAGAHRPDRERMLARVERGMAGAGPPARVVRPPRTATPWLRVAAATAAVCGVLAAGTFAVTSAGGEGAHEDRGAAPPSATGTPGGTLRTEDGPLRTDGAVDPHSNAYWAQSNVTLRATEPLASLTVELRIALTGGVTSTGSWRSLPEGDFTVSATEDSSFLIYRWRLKPGRSVPAGTHTFAGQYNHAEGERDPAGDYVTVRAVRASGRPASVGDSFGPDR